jgi:Zn-dependent peptidase ImmA (M78 family)
MERRTMPDSRHAASPTGNPADHRRVPPPGPGCDDNHNAGMPGREEARALAHDLLATTQRECPGWNPPPFAPDLYARVLDISVLRIDDDGPWDAMYIPLPVRPSIVLNTRSASTGRMNFSLAHEIAHSLLAPAPNGARHYRARPDYYDGSVATRKLERACDEIAAELLMPGAWFREAISRRGLCAQAVPAIAGDFGVSLEAAAARIVETAEIPCAVGFFHHTDARGRITSPPAASRAWSASEEESGSGWRTRRVFHSPGFPWQFRTAQPVPADSILMTTALTGRPGSAVEAFLLGPEWRTLRVSTIAMGAGAGRAPLVVIGVFFPADPRGPVLAR